ncbi:hypothetical protein AAMO2058_000435000 [Amorphochlora amoebiformis]
MRTGTRLDGIRSLLTCLSVLGAIFTYVDWVAVPRARQLVAFSNLRYQPDAQSISNLLERVIEKEDPDTFEFSPEPVAGIRSEIPDPEPHLKAPAYLENDANNDEGDEEYEHSGKSRKKTRGSLESPIPGGVDKLKSQRSEMRQSGQHVDPTHHTREDFPVAILLVGSPLSIAASHGEEHIEVMYEEIVRKLNADVFMVSHLVGPSGIGRFSESEENLPDEQTSYLHNRYQNRLICDPSLFDSYVSMTLTKMPTHVKAVGFVTVEGTSSVVGSYCGEKMNQTRFVGIPPYPSYDRDKAIGYQQWQKLRSAWELMEDYEKSVGRQYKGVIRLRFDTIPFPWNVSKLYEVMSSEDRVLKHITDLLFWGSRDMMKIACSLGSALESFWFNQRPKAGSRPFWTRAFYQSIINTPHIAWQQDDDGVWKFYTKIGTMFFPNVIGSASSFGSIDEMRENIRVLFCTGVDYVDPLLPGSPPMVDTHMTRGCDCNLDGYFLASEKDFVVWMIYHNVTMCDVGAGTHSLISKGKYWRRKSYDKCQASITRERAGCDSSIAS